MLFDGPYFWTDKITGTQNWTGRHPSLRYPPMPREKNRDDRITAKSGAEAVDLVGFDRGLEPEIYSSDEKEKMS